ncbi:histidine kinase [Neolewinella lacunae]|uniref:Histidine kinase n=1 Tax=Neolewinella lacunae TaxID=1517758 RepID=A0A923T7T3_9BACT|nr:histidine kinase [Neolewinella lacunae]MBC6993851.1 histidine kinase [Neolewinella lacunae]MDN3637088.1 histidine kinase [Neolewinella lacunae]
MSTLLRDKPSQEISGFLDRLGHTLTRQPYYHAGGWLAFFVLLVAMQWRTGEFSFGISLANELINVAFYIVVVYINLLYLFPAYLKKGQYWTYLLLLLAISFVFTPLKLVLKYVLFTKAGGLQEDILNNLYAYFFSTFLVAGLSTVGKIMVDWIVLNRKKVKTENETMQSELRFLKSQINPHFLFNTLNSLYALTLKKDDKAPDIVIKLSEMMRYMLYECNEPRVPLRKEINYLRNYLDLERLRQRKGIDIQLEVSGAVTDQMVAPLMFIPFLENSFKHGVNAAINDGFVKASLHAEDRSVRFIIENSKGSIMPSQVHGNRPSGGIGLVNVRRRLDLLYPNAYELEIKESPATYAVHLSLKL